MTAAEDFQTLRTSEGQIDASNSMRCVHGSSLCTSMS
jgi:hypothetical protein